MLLANALDFTWMVVMIEFIGALLIVGYVIAALMTLLHTRNVTQARLLVADGVIIGLSFKLAGTLLKTIELRSWQQILIFCAILTLRTLLKRFFSWEKNNVKHPMAKARGFYAVPRTEHTRHGLRGPLPGPFVR